jgi:hypothetical protein
MFILERLGLALLLALAVPLACAQELRPWRGGAAAPLAL